MTVHLRHAARHVILLLLLLLCTGVYAQSPTTPSIRGFVVGAEYTLFQPYFPSVPLGQGTNFWFGYRPDIPQSPTTHKEVPVTFGPNSDAQSGWPFPTQHITYNPFETSPASGTLPAFDLFGHATPYANNSGYYPGISALSINASATIGSDTINVSANHWGGFYGVLRGSNGVMNAQGLPWSSSGSDYGYSNAGDPNYQAFAPGPAVVNFYLYDINGSTPIADANGNLVYDLNSAPNNTPGSNQARGRLTLRRKDFGARWEYGIDPNARIYANTFILQGIWQIVNVEGSFTSVFSSADLNKTVGTYGQPDRFFAGLNYNDFNFYNNPVGGLNYEKSLVYQFLTAALSVTRSYNICTNQISSTVTNTGDAALSNIIVTDTQAGSAAPFSLAVGASNTITQTPTSPYAKTGVSTATANQFNIERSLDLFNMTGTLADTSLNVSGVPDNPIITASASSASSQLAACLQICGYVYSKASLSDTTQTPVSNVTLTLTGFDLNGNAITPATTTTNAAGYYCFTNVPPGNYTITETVPSAYRALGAIAGDAGTVVSATIITVAATQTGVGSYNNEDFLLTQSGSLSGLVYCDTSKNGKYDSGEPLLSGVTVTATFPNGTTKATTTTDANGHYNFTGLPAGSYTVSVPATTGGKTIETTNPLTVVVMPNQDTPNNNFGYIVPVGSLSGTVYCDTNKNGTYDSGEPLLSGVTVTLTYPDGTTKATTTTDANGHYSFTGLPAGSYTVSVPATTGGKTIETASPLTVTVVANQDKPGNNFGYIVPVGSLSGLVYCDTNKNSKYDSGEPLLSGVTVTLTYPDGTTKATTTTDANGHYSFTGLPVGSYTVSVPATVNGKTIETASPLMVTVVANQDAPNNNFGYIVPVGSLSGTVYCDVNRNKLFDTGDTGISGVTVTLTYPDGTTKATTTTDANGHYSFTGLPAGSYTVSVPATADGKTLETASPLTVTVVANQDAPNNNFGYIVPVGSLSGNVYNDVNRNKLFDTGDTGISGVTITLTKPDGSTATATTTSTGAYGFTGLTAGTYTVTAPTTAGGNNLETNNPLTVTVAANQDAPNNNFGYVVPVGSLSGFAYVDSNKNGVFDTGEAGLTGVTVTLTKPDGSTATYTTTSTGAYGFTNLVPGTYTVKTVTTVNGKTVRTSNPLTVTVASNKNTANNNFGYW